MMDRSVTFDLIRATRSQDSLGQWVTSDTVHSVYGQEVSITQNEFFSAGAAGYKPEVKLIMFAPDYSGEDRVLLHGVEYAVYRTYRTRNDNIELYLERRQGSRENDGEAS